MAMVNIRATLLRAAALFRAGGALGQARALDQVEQLLADSGDVTVDQFVDRTRAALARPRLDEMAVDLIVKRLEAIDTDRSAFSSLLSEMKQRGFSKEKTIEVAVAYTGAQATRLKSKPQALKTIENKFDERVYLASKEAMNQNVTPW